MNKRAFKSVMVCHGDTQKDIATALDITEQTVCKKLNGLSDFKQSEIKILIDRYNLTPAQVDEMFFGVIK